jgi:F-type H+-transporting ATPase subunit c
VNRLAKIAALVVALVLAASPAAAQEPAAANSWTVFPDTFGPALIILGAAWGIGRIGAHAVEAMARQPEVVNNIQTAMIISAALVEGATFFALIICLLALQA